MMKRFAALFLTCALLVGLCACGAPAEEGTGTTTTTPTTTTTTEPPVPSVTIPTLVGEDAPVAATLDGVSFSEYTIVYDADASDYTIRAALYIRDEIHKRTGAALDIVTDDVAEATYELVIGNTNRAGSARAAAVELAADEYILMMDDESVIMWGESYMVGGGAGAFATQYAAGAWRGYDIDVTDIPTEATPTKFVFEEAKSAILLIGDGMGEKHIDMTLANGLDKFCARDMPNISWIV